MGLGLQTRADVPEFEVRCEVFEVFRELVSETNQAGKASFEVFRELVPGTNHAVIMNRDHQKQEKPV